MSTRTGWKGALLVTLSLAVLGLAACGGGGAAATSGLAKRAFVSDDIDGTLHIEDAQNDIESFSRISIGPQPGVMRLSPDKSITLVFSAGSSTLSVVTNATESVLGSIFLPNLSTDYVALAGNTVGFAAVPNSNTTPCVPRCIEVLNVATTFNVTGTINTASTTTTPPSTVPLAAATTLALSPDGGKLLVFGASGDHVDTLTFISTSVAQTTPASAATQLGSVDCTNASLPANCFDRPVSAVFTSDSSKAFVFNCGPECGGTAAGVTVLNVTTTPPAPTGYIPFPATAGATVGLLSGSNLFVAGTPSGTPGALAGRLSVLNITALAPPASSISISDGYHNHMELGSNNKLFIGAITCSAGCLTIFPSSNNANAAVVDGNTGNVTGIAPINGRNVVYVVEDLVAGSFQGKGELRIYDTTTDALTPTQIDVVGAGVDVKYVDQ